MTISIPIAIALMAIPIAIGIRAVMADRVNIIPIIGLGDHRAWPLQHHFGIELMVIEHPLALRRVAVSIVGRSVAISIGSVSGGFWSTLELEVARAIDPQSVLLRGHSGFTFGWEFSMLG